MNTNVNHLWTRQTWLDGCHALPCMDFERQLQPEVGWLVCQQLPDVWRRRPAAARHSRVTAFRRHPGPFVVCNCCKRPSRTRGARRNVGRLYQPCSTHAAALLAFSCQAARGMPMGPPALLTAVQVDITALYQCLPHGPRADMLGAGSAGACPAMILWSLPHTTPTHRIFTRCTAECCVPGATTGTAAAGGGAPSVDNVGPKCRLPVAAAAESDASLPGAVSGLEQQRPCKACVRHGIDGPEAAS